MRLLGLAAGAALGVWLWMALHPSPERLIRRQLAGVADAVSFGPGQGSLARLAAAERLGDFFSTNVDVRIDVPGRQEHRLAGREEIQQAALAARASLHALRVTLPDVVIIVDADQASAVADLTLEARLDEEPDRIVQEMKVTLRKIDGQWLIVKVETVRTLGDVFDGAAPEEEPVQLTKALNRAAKSRTPTAILNFFIRGNCTIRQLFHLGKGIS
jgi:hypothetical protein